MWLVPHSALFLFCAFAGFSVGDAVLQGRQPHIVFVLADDYGYHDVGYHGSEIQTPVLDQLSAEGVRLENYYVQPICSPTRGQLMSGRYQIHTGMQHGVIRPEQPRGLPIGIPTLPEKLKEAGYATHMVGKWHIGFYTKKALPHYRGFDSFYGIYVGAEDHFTHERNFLFNATQKYVDLHDNDQPVFNESGHYSTHLFTAKAVQKIQAHDPSKAVHSPLQVPRKYMQPYPHIQDIKRRIYAAMVAVMDEGVGNVTKALKDAGMWDNTVFVFSTDNGAPMKWGGNNYPLRGSKNTLWEGGIRGVAFVTAPGMATANTVSRELIHVSDWFPTLVRLGGGSLKGTQLDGVDQWDTISQGVPSSRRQLLHNIDMYPSYRRGFVYKFKGWHPGLFDNTYRAAIREGDWKLITGYPGNGAWQKHPVNPSASTDPQDPFLKNLWLFNITADPSERNDLSSDNTAVVKRLLGLLQEHQNTAVPLFFPPNDPNSNPALRGNVWGPWL